MRVADSVAHVMTWWQKRGRTPLAVAVDPGRGVGPTSDRPRGDSRSLTRSRSLENSINLLLSVQSGDRHAEPSAHVAWRLEGAAVISPAVLPAQCCHVQSRIFPSRCLANRSHVLADLISTLHRKPGVEAEAGLVPGFLTAQSRTGSHFKGRAVFGSFLATASGAESLS